MSHRKLKTTLAGCAFFIAAIGIANTSYALGFTIALDTMGMGGYPTWAGTTSTVTIEAQINNSWLVVYVGPIEELDEPNPVDTYFGYNKHEFRYPAFNFSDVTAVRISIDGGDALFLDQVHLYGDLWVRGDPPHTWWWDPAKTWGVDDNTGFCLSTEYENASALAYCYQGKVGWRWTFTIP